MSSKFVYLVVVLFVCTTFVDIAFADDAGSFGDEGNTYNNSC